MAPKRGAKRKATEATSNGDVNGASALMLPDRESWPGWVEVENEPNRFTVMLRQMGVKGLEARDLYDLSEIIDLPRPVFAFIFLFQYADEDMRSGGNEADCSHVWFANQVPDFACASLALLNIVNNIPNLDLGKQLRDFKDFTKDMDPVTRGDTIDNFDFVKRIHNSFASQNDLLNADAVTKDKFSRFKKRQATAKGAATRVAKKAEKEKAANGDASALGDETSKAAPSEPTKRSAPSRKSYQDAGQAHSERHPEADYDPKTKSNDKVGTSTTNGDELPAPRRSGRERKPTRVNNAIDAQDEEEDNGHHFVAYVPINNHVWMLDGLNKWPQDLGAFEPHPDDPSSAHVDPVEWMTIASTDLQIRMIKGGNGYSCMALVADEFSQEKPRLAGNVKTLQAIDRQLDSLDNEWRSIEGGETKRDVITGISETFGLSQADVDDAELPASKAVEISSADDILALLNLRRSTIETQASIRRDTLTALKKSQDLDTDGVHLRHDYENFVRSWVGALADEGVLADLVSG